MTRRPAPEPPSILVSACLLGQHVRYDGTSARVESSVLEDWAAEGRAIAFCPEVAAGGSVPRPAAEIVGGDGHQVLDGRARVIDATGRDVTSAFTEGARGALSAALASGARAAILKEGSPSCGSNWTHDGSFSGQLVTGPGVAAALLERNGIRVFGEHEVDQAAAYVARFRRT
jgi:uncharacterized protein YbbK (DUF523 family)